MHILASFPTDAETAELVQPGKRTLHYPPGLPQTTAMWGVALRQQGMDLSLAQPTAVRLGIIAPIPLHHVGPTPGSSWFPSYRWDRLDQRLQLGDIMGIGSRETYRQRNSVGVRNHVMFAARFGAIRGIGARLRPPQPPAPKRCPPPPGTSLTGRPRGADPRATDATAPRPRPPAIPAADANKSSRNRSPFPGAASPRGCLIAKQRGGPSAPAGWVPGAGPLWVWASPVARGERSAPTTHRLPVPSPSAFPPRENASDLHFIPMLLTVLLEALRRGGRVAMPRRLVTSASQATGFSYVPL